jgi:hypothetical protein
MRERRSARLAVLGEAEDRPRTGRLDDGQRFVLAGPVT